MEIYNLNNINTGNKKAEEIYSLVIEQASENAEALALKDWGNSRDNFHIEINNEIRLSDEAQDIFNDYYDVEVDKLWKLAINCIKIHNK
jgi:hypothetical protein